MRKIRQSLNLMNKKQNTTSQKTPLQIIEKRYGKGPSVTSDAKIRVYLDSKGHKSLSKLIEAR